MHIRPIASSIALHSGLGLAGALAGGVAFHVTARGPRRTGDFIAAPGAFVGAVAAPSAYHLAKPLVAHGLKHGAADALRTSPPLVFAGLAAGGPFGVTALVGGAIGSTVGDDGLDAGSVSALPGATLGAIAGPALYAGMRTAWGAVPGSLAFMALAVGTASWQASRR